MATSEQFIPLSEEQQEEKNRLSGGNRGHAAFVPIEEVPDDALLPDQFEERERITISESDAQKIEALKDEVARLEKPLGYMEREGVASVGPDVLETYPEATEVSVDHLPDHVSPNGLAFENAIGSREKASAVSAEPKKWIMLRYKDNRKDWDNQKTVPASKRERGMRGWLRKLLTGEIKTDKAA